MGKEENKDESSGVKEIMEESKKDQRSQRIAGIDHWPDLAANIIRPSLPRRSKTMHKVIPDKTMQRGTPGKHGKGSNKNSLQ